ncbi:MAG: Maf family protein [Gemmatimonadota bacterium]
MRLILASASPRRADLLRMLGLHFETWASDVPEERGSGEAPEEYVVRLAREKAAAAPDPRALVVAGDTVVVHRGDVLEKPRDEADALAMLLRLSGEPHTVFSGLALRHPEGGLFSTCTEVRVHFRSFDADTARRYVETGEPLDKAGAYGVQSKGAVLVDRVEGDFFAVMGLSVVALTDLLGRAGVTYPFGPLEW